MCEITDGFVHNTTNYVCYCSGKVESITGELPAFNISGKYHSTNHRYIYSISDNKLIKNYIDCSKKDVVLGDNLKMELDRVVRLQYRPCHWNIVGIAAINYFYVDIFLSTNSSRTDMLIIRANVANDRVNSYQLQMLYSVYNRALDLVQNRILASTYKPVSIAIDYYKETLYVLLNSFSNSIVLGISISKSNYKHHIKWAKHLCEKVDAIFDDDLGVVAIKKRYGCITIKRIEVVIKN